MLGRQVEKGGSKEKISLLGEIRDLSLPSRIAVREGEKSEDSQRIGVDEFVRREGRT